MSQNDRFINQVVLDPRSYKEENFQKIIKLIKHNRISIPGDSSKEFQAFTERCKVKFEENTLKETFMDDAPDDYVDQLFCVLMDHPVKLPSGNTVDLNQLKKHFINDPTDPYTRQPMKLEDVEEMPELKEKIAEFKKEKLEEFHKEMEKRRQEINAEAEQDIDHFE